MIWLLACATTCPDTPGPERDACLHLRSADLEAPGPTIEQIQDPVIRTAAVFGWMQRHADQADRDQALELCALLDGEDRTICARRLEAAHLR